MPVTFATVTASMGKILHHSRRQPAPHDAGRRQFLRASLAVAGGLIAAPAIATSRKTGERRIRLLNLHTGEKGEVLYWSGGEFQNGGLQELNHLLRDHRTGDIYAMDTGLFDLVHDLGDQFGGRRRVEIISGYRSPATNRSLRNGSSGVAKRSLHMQGKAMDLRLDGVSLKKVRQAALNMKRGGVGFYPKSDFVHIDTGRVRHW